jgi:hypothetical protein
MLTTFLGLFLFSTALSLAATFTVVGGKALVRRRQVSLREPSRH